MTNGTDFVLGFINRFKMLLLVAGVLSLPVVFLYVQRRIPAVREMATGTVIDSSRSVQTAIVAWFGGASDRYQRYVNALDSYDRLHALERRTPKIRALKAALLEVQGENERLIRLLKFSQTFEGPSMIGARIIGRTGAPLSRTIQIDRGRKDGVKRGDGVVSADGVVGQVIAVGLRMSEVLLVTDSSSAIDVVIQRSRAQGILRGTSADKRYTMRVGDFDRLHDVEVGDLVVSSGVGARFPVGTPVGHIIAKRVSPSGLYVEAEIKPDTEFGHIEEVLVLTQGSAQHAWRRKSAAVEMLNQCVVPHAK